MIEIREAQVKKEGSPKEGLSLLSCDEQVFVGKPAICRKYVEKEKKDEPLLELTWLMNEAVYYSIAKSAGLRMPEARILVVPEDGLFFGSEYLSSAKPMQDQGTLKEVVSVNLDQLTRALVLDLLLFNSDRTIGRQGDILCDDGKLFFIDHGHSLWGDGRCFGDLHRIEHECYSPEIVRGYVKDFLRCKEANALVWKEDNWSLAQKLFRETREKTKNEFRSACDSLKGLQRDEGVTAWRGSTKMLFQPRLVSCMAEALGKWAEELHRGYFQDGDGWNKIADLSVRSRSPRSVAGNLESRFPDSWLRAGTPCRGGDGSNPDP